MLLAVTGSDDKQVKLWDVASHQSLHTFYDHNEYVTYVVSIFIFIFIFIFILFFFFIFIFIFIFIVIFISVFILFHFFPLFSFLSLVSFLTIAFCFSKAARNVNRRNLYSLYVNISILDFLYPRIPFMFYFYFQS